MGLLEFIALQTEFAVLGGTLCLGFGIAWLIVWILVAVWVYKDAESRGMGGILWLLVVLFIGLIGLIIYLIVRGSHPVRPPGYPAGYPYPQPQYAAPPQYPAGPPQYPGAPPQYPAAPPQYPGVPPQYGGPPPAQAAPPVAARCKNCEAPLAPGAGFCASCGTKV